MKMMKKLEALGVGFEELEKINIDFNLHIRSETLRNQMREGKYNNKKLPVFRRLLCFLNHNDFERNTLKSGGYHIFVVVWIQMPS